MRVNKKIGSLGGTRGLPGAETSQHGLNKNSGLLAGGSKTDRVFVYMGSFI